MRPLKLKCTNPQCRRTLLIPEEMYGQRVRCAACGHSFVVPILRIEKPKATRRYRKAS